MMEQIKGWMKEATDIGISLIALAIVLQIIFGSVVPFVGGDIIGTITGIIAKLGAQGLVGLVAAAVLYKILSK